MAISPLRGEVLLGGEKASASCHWVNATGLSGSDFIMFSEEGAGKKGGQGSTKDPLKKGKREGETRSRKKSRGGRARGSSCVRGGPNRAKKKKWWANDVHVTGEVERRRPYLR